METKSVVDPTDLTNRYLEIWNENDEPRRNTAIRALWAEGGGHVAPSIEVYGHEAIEARVARTHQRWVVEEGYRFASRGNATAHHNAVKFTWEMVPAAGGKADSVGVDLFLLDDDGRLRCVYQFIEE
jgi:hypothetical protein